MIGIGVNIRPFLNKVARAAADYYNRITADGGVSESPDCVNTTMSVLDRQNLLNSASLLISPSGYKGGKLYAEIPSNGNGDLTWTRGGDGFRTNASGLIQRVPWNLLQRSEEFDNSIWTKTGCSITTNTTTAPNGTTTADKLVSTNLATGSSVYQVGTIIANATYTFSIYVKASGANWIQLIATGTTTTSPARLWVDLSNGVLGTNNGGYSGASVTNVGDGWYRVRGTFTTTSSATFSNLFCALATGDNINAFNGDGVSGVFIWGAQLVEGTTAQTYFPTTDRLNVPRLDYTYGSCPAVLLEPQRTNLVLQSNTFNTTWALFGGATITSNSTTSPDGSTNATTLNSAGGGNDFLFQNVNTTIGTAYALTLYVKNVNTSAARFFTPIAATPAVDITWSGSVITSVTGVGGTYSFASVGNGWYRVTAVVTATASSFVYRIYSDTNNTSKSMYIYGVQIEAGAYPTTYIPTTSATATRVADSFSRNNIYTNGLITSSGGTWFVEFRNNVAYTRDAIGIALQITDSTFQNLVRLRFPPSGRIIIDKVVSNVGTFLIATTSTTCKLAIKWNGTTMDIFENGTKVVSATSFTPTIMESLLGDGAQAPTFIQQMALFPSPLSDTDCTTLTTL